MRTRDRERRAIRRIESARVFNNKPKETINNRQLKNCIFRNTTAKGSMMENKASNITSNTKLQSRRERHHYVDYY